MNRKIEKRVICAAVSLLVSASAFASPAFASDPAQAETAADTAVTAADQASAGDEMVKTRAITGKVTDIEWENTDFRVTLDDGKDGYILHFTRLDFIYDQKAKSYARWSDIVTGTQITAFTRKDSPVMMSMPPQVSAVFGIIINSDAGANKLGYFDNDLIAGDNSLKLNIGESTAINSGDGEKTAFTAEDLKNRELLVFYDVTTKSYPPQTAPYLVIVIPEHNGTYVVKASEYAGLREGAEARGYTVTWVSNSEPVTLTKGDITVTVTIGSDEFTYTHLTKDMHPLDSLEKLPLVTELADGKTMVSKTFIWLLK